MPTFSGKAQENFVRVADLVHELGWTRTLTYLQELSYRQEYSMRCLSKNPVEESRAARELSDDLLDLMNTRRNLRLRLGLEV